MTPTETCQFGDFCCHIVNGNVELKTCPFYFQVQRQTAVANVQWCDFAVWTENGDLWDSLYVERVYFDKVFSNSKVLPSPTTFTALASDASHKKAELPYRTGKGYVPCLKNKEGFYLCEGNAETLKLCIRKLK